LVSAHAAAFFVAGYPTSLRHTWVSLEEAKFSRFVETRLLKRESLDFLFEEFFTRVVHCFEKNKLFPLQVDKLQYIHEGSGVVLQFCREQKLRSENLYFLLFVLQILAFLLLFLNFVPLIALLAR